MSGKEHRALERVHLGVMANAPNTDDKLLEATRALLDYIYMAQYPSHDDDTLAELTQSIQGFQAVKDVWIENGTRSGKNGTIEHQNIPKIHGPLHLVEDIMEKGSSDNTTSETPEHLHVVYCKRPYLSTNRKNPNEQMARWMDRTEKVAAFGSWLFWTERSFPENDFYDSDSDFDPEDEYQQDPENKATTTSPHTDAQVTRKINHIGLLLSPYQKIAKTPSRSRITLAALKTLFRLPSLENELVKFLSAARLPAHEAYHQLDVWFAVRLKLPSVDMVHYAEEWRKIRAIPEIDDKPITADPVLLRDAASPFEPQIVGFSGELPTSGQITAC